MAWECLYDATFLQDGLLYTEAGRPFTRAGPGCHLREDNSPIGQVHACVVPVETGRDCVAAQWDSSPFDSVPASIWWALVTICTVGALPIVHAPPGHGRAALKAAVGWGPISRVFHVSQETPPTDHRTQSPACPMVTTRSMCRIWRCSAPHAVGTDGRGFGHDWGPDDDRFADYCHRKQFFHCVSQSAG